MYVYIRCAGGSIPSYYSSPHVHNLQFHHEPAELNVFIEQTRVLSIVCYYKGVYMIFKWCIVFITITSVCCFYLYFTFVCPMLATVKGESVFALSLQLQ